MNLAGYSYGSVLQAHVALRLSQMGYKIDNVSLIGSPIPAGSELSEALSQVTNLIRIDIPGDKLSNPSSEWAYMEGARQNSDDSGPHFDLARPGPEADKKIQEAADKLRREGVQ